MGLLQLICTLGSRNSWSAGMTTGMQAKPLHGSSSLLLLICISQSLTCARCMGRKDAMASLNTQAVA